MLPLLGLTQASFLVFDGFLIHSLVSGLAMLVVMMRRSRESERRLVAAEQQAADERHQREEQAQLLTMLAHELKTPLAVVRMALGSRSPSHELLGDADRSVRDMTYIIQRCLQVEKLGYNNPLLQRRPCHLGEEMRDLMNNACRPSRLYWVGAELPPVDTDPMILRMIVANLLDNACKYGAPDQPVTLHLTARSREGQNWQCLRVTNRPCQNNWPDPEKLFEKYYRAPQSHEHSGSGLGLYLSNRLAEQLGGTLRYHPTSSEIGFELWIPA
jgi:signal transduction histidine kinase